MIKSILPPGTNGACTRPARSRPDRFNRPTRSIWTKDNTGTDVDFLDLDVTWDRNSNVTRNVDNIHFRATGTLGDGRFDEAYTIDGLNRLTGYERGNWNGSAIANDTQGEGWTLDQVGNWDLHNLDLTGDGDYIDTGEFQEDRAHNVVNELTDRDQDTDNDSSYDDNNWNLVYDATGRSIQLVRQIDLRRSGSRREQLSAMASWRSGVGPGDRGPVGL